MTTIHQPHRPAAESIPELGAGLLARLHAGDRAAFGDLYLLTELPSAVRPDQRGCGP